MAEECPRIERPFMIRKCKKGERTTWSPPLSLSTLESGLYGPSTDFLALKHTSRILGHSSNPVYGFSMTELVRPCAVRPMENWLGSLNQVQGWTTVRESYSRALKQGPLQLKKGKDVPGPFPLQEM